MDEKMDETAWTPIWDRPVILDFTKCRYIGDFHQVLRKAFGFPAYYGENPAALWDLIKGFFGDRRNMGLWEVHVFGWERLEQLFGLDYTRMYWSVLKDVEKVYPNARFILKS